LKEEERVGGLEITSEKGTRVLLSIEKASINEHKITSSKTATL
jgi:hypothetical protein